MIGTDTPRPTPRPPPHAPLEGALAHAARGRPIFPCGADKRPLTPHGFKDATTEQAQIQEWWGRWPTALIGMPTGAPSRVFVLDIDIDPASGKDGEASLAALMNERPPLPDTVESLTPRGGRHLFFRHPGGTVPCSASKIGPDLDIRGDGGYVVLPPSCLPDGRAYHWEGSSDPDEGSRVAAAPDWLLALVTGPSKAREAPASPGGTDGATVPEGGRNATLASLAGTMRRRGMAGPAILAALLAENEARCRPPLHQDEVAKIAASVERYAPARDASGPTPSATEDGDPGPWCDTGETTEAEWPDLAPLPGLPEVPAFEPGLLPAAFRLWLMDVSERIQCPADFPAVGAIVALAAVVGRQVAIRPKRKDDWTVVPNLWGAAVGRPGVLKTPALTEPMRPLGRLEGLARVAHEEVMRDFEAAQLVAEQRKAVGKEAIRAALKKGHNPEGLAREALGDTETPPARVRYTTSDASVEKLGELLRDNPRGLLVYRDELTGLLRSLDREGNETSRAFYLESWNGTGGFTFDRIGRGTVEIEGACVSILGGIQPGPLGEYLRAAVAGGAGDDGLLQRFQVVAWPDIGGDWRNIDRWPDSGARDRAWAVFDRLNTLDPGALGAERDGDGTAFLRFDGDAQELFTEWRGGLERRLRAGEEAPAFEAHLSKFRSLVPSLALLLHLADHEAGPVGEPALLAACAWAEYLEGHARRLYAPAVGLDLAAARELTRHLRRGDLGGEFTLRELVRKGWRGLDAGGAPRILEALTELGWVRGRTVQTGGRPTVLWTVNPAAGRARP